MIINKSLQFPKCEFSQGHPRWKVWASNHDLLGKLGVSIHKRVCPDQFPYKFGVKIPENGGKLAQDQQNKTPNNTSFTTQVCPWFLLIYFQVKRYRTRPKRKLLYVSTKIEPNKDLIPGWTFILMIWGECWRANISNNKTCFSIWWHLNALPFREWHSTV